MYDNLYLAILLSMICIIFYVIHKRISGKRYAVIAIIICLLFIYVNPYIKKMLDIKEDSQCITNGVKKFGGLLAGGCLDYWHIYHIVFWILIGLFVPGRYLMVFILSVLWELFEHCVCVYITHYCNAGSICGRVEDIFSNILGYFIGSIIVLHYGK